MNKKTLLPALFVIVVIMAGLVSPVSAKSPVNNLLIWTVRWGEENGGFWATELFLESARPTSIYNTVYFRNLPPAGVQRAVGPGGVRATYAANPSNPWRPIGFQLGWTQGQNSWAGMAWSGDLPGPEIALKVEWKNEGKVKAVEIGVVNYTTQTLRLTWGKSSTELLPGQPWSVRVKSTGDLFIDTKEGVRVANLWWKL